jgi:hypothetical protein
MWCDDQRRRHTESVRGKIKGDRGRSRWPEEDSHSLRGRTSARFRSCLAPAEKRTAICQFLACADKTVIAVAAYRSSTRCSWSEARRMLVSADGRHRHSHRAETNALLKARHLPAIVVALNKPPGLVSKRFASGVDRRRGRLTKLAHLHGRAARRETSVGDNAMTDEESTYFS